jgi:hypothetical protein
MFVPRRTPTSAFRRAFSNSTSQARDVSGRTSRPEFLTFHDQAHLHSSPLRSALWFGTGNASRIFSLVGRRRRVLFIGWPRGNVDHRSSRDRCCQEVRMQLTRWGAGKTSADVISGILNCVCPECGGSMGGVGKEFKCQGQCQADWRQTWEQVFSGGLNRRTTRAIRPS